MISYKINCDGYTMFDDTYLNLQEFSFPKIPRCKNANVAEYLQKQLGHVNANAYWKDSSNLYQWINQKQAEISQLARASDVINRPLFDFVDEETAYNIEKVDSNIIETGEKALLIETGIYKQGLCQRVFSIKQQLKDTSGRVLGLIGVSFNIEYPPYSKQQFMFNAKNKGLSEKQRECLYFLMCGLSAKKIATVMGISKRTVESYIDILKTKLHCQHKVDLIEVALQCYTGHAKF